VLDVLMAEAVLGRDADEFLSSELGRYMVGRCDQEIAEAQDQLSDVSPWRRRKIQDLQNKIWRAKAAKEWLAELIANGRAAESALEEAQ
jgi:hypothetical protein